MPKIPIDILLIILLVIAVSFLLYRLSREKKRTRFLKGIDISRLQCMLLKKAPNKELHKAAGEISKILRDFCEADRIIYLRNQTDHLELNYFFGINNFDKRDLRIDSPELLFDFFSDGNYPITVNQLNEYIPFQLTEHLNSWGIDLAFPIIGHKKLHGLYFIRSAVDSSLPEFKLLLNSISQSLAAVYQVESDSENLEKVKKVELTTTYNHTNGDSISSNLLKLVRHRNSDTLVGKIVDQLKKELDLEQVAFLYTDRCKNEPTRIQQRGLNSKLEVPRQELFDKLLSCSMGNEPETIAQLSSLKNEIGQWGSELQSAGLKYMIPFKLSSDRSGLFLWQDEKNPDEVREKLKEQANSIMHLFENAESFERVKELSYTDNLTGLSNRRYFLKRLNEEILRASRHNRPMSLVIFDLDDLKGVNDRYGHQAGDQILTQIGTVLQNSVRSIDVVARYGGDEFCIIMPETDKATLNRFMDRLQGRITGTKFKVDQFKKELSSSISQGGAVFPEHGSDSEQLIFAADMALLKAKEGGRNRFLIP